VITAIKIMKKDIQEMDSDGKRDKITIFPLNIHTIMRDDTILPATVFSPFFKSIKFCV